MTNTLIPKTNYMDLWVIKLTIQVLPCSGGKKSSISNDRVNSSNSIRRPSIDDPSNDIQPFFKQICLT